MPYTTINKSSDHFNTKLFTGTGSSNAITGVGFQPDWVWIKDRQDSHSHNLFTSLIGATKRMNCDTHDAETTNAESLKSFDSDGFTLGTQTNVNQSGHTNVAWNWKASGASGSGTTAGSGTSKAYSYIVNLTAGFSITKFVGNGTSGHRIPHSLGATPKIFMIKNRSRGTTDWQIYSPVNDPTDALALNQSDATGDSESYWSDEAPDATHIVVGGGGAVNYNGDDLVCYAWKEVSGYSSFGQYVGNGSLNGKFCFTGHKPALVILKRTNTSNNWIMFDNKRDPYNEAIRVLYPNTTTVEDAGTGANDIDFLSNGFKIREDNGECNGNGDSYIYISFAAAPLVGTNNIPCTAR